MNKATLGFLFGLIFWSVSAIAACPTGQHFDASMNMCMPDPTCLAGQHYDASMNMCMPNVVVTPTPTCPAGQYWDATMGAGMCMPIPAPTSFRGISKNIFAVTCLSCHQVHTPTEPAEGGIDFSSYQAMMNSNQNPSNPHHAPFIVPGHPEQSKLYLALQSGKMPATEEEGEPGEKLSDELIQNVYDWIKAGALNN